MHTRPSARPTSNPPPSTSVATEQRRPQGQARPRTTPRYPGPKFGVKTPDLEQERCNYVPVERATSQPAGRTARSTASGTPVPSDVEAASTMPGREQSGDKAFVPPTMTQHSQATNAQGFGASSQSATGSSYEPFEASSVSSVRKHSTQQQPQNSCAQQQSPQTGQGQNPRSSQTALDSEGSSNQADDYPLTPTSPPSSLFDDDAIGILANAQSGTSGAVSIVPGRSPSVVASPLDMAASLLVSSPFSDSLDNLMDHEDTFDDDGYNHREESERHETTTAKDNIAIGSGGAGASDSNAGDTMYRVDSADADQVLTQSPGAGKDGERVAMTGPFDAAFPLPHLSASLWAPPVPGQSDATKDLATITSVARRVFSNYATQICNHMQTSGVACGCYRAACVPFAEHVVPLPACDEMADDALVRHCAEVAELNRSGLFALVAWRHAAALRAAVDSWFEHFNAVFDSHGDDDDDRDSDSAVPCPASERAIPCSRALSAWQSRLSHAEQEHIRERDCKPSADVDSASDRLPRDVASAAARAWLTGFDVDASKDAAHDTRIFGAVWKALQRAYLIGAASASAAQANTTNAGTSSNHRDRPRDLCSTAETLSPRKAGMAVARAVAVVMSRSIHPESFALVPEDAPSVISPTYVGPRQRPLNCAAGSLNAKHTQGVLNAKHTQGVLNTKRNVECGDNDMRNGSRPEHSAGDEDTASRSTMGAVGSDWCTLYDADVDFAEQHANIYDSIDHYISMLTHTGQERNPTAEATLANTGALVDARVGDDRQSLVWPHGSATPIVLDRRQVQAASDSTPKAEAWCRVSWFIDASAGTAPRLASAPSQAADAADTAIGESSLSGGGSITGKQRPLVVVLAGPQAGGMPISVRRPCTERPKSALAPVLYAVSVVNLPSGSDYAALVRHAAKHDRLANVVALAKLAQSVKEAVHTIGDAVEERWSRVASRSHRSHLPTLASVRLVIEEPFDADPTSGTAGTGSSAQPTVVSCHIRDYSRGGSGSSSPSTSAGRLLVCQLADADVNRAGGDVVRDGSDRERPRVCGDYAWLAETVLGIEAASRPSGWPLAWGVVPSDFSSTYSNSGPLCGCAVCVGRQSHCLRHRQTTSSVTTAREQDTRAAAAATATSGPTAMHNGHDKVCVTGSRAALAMPRAVELSEALPVPSMPTLMAFGRQLDEAWNEARDLHRNCHTRQAMRSSTRTESDNDSRNDDGDDDHGANTRDNLDDTIEQALFGNVSSSEQEHASVRLGALLAKLMRCSELREAGVRAVVRRLVSSLGRRSGGSSMVSSGDDKDHYDALPHGAPDESAGPSRTDQVGRLLAAAYSPLTGKAIVGALGGDGLASAMASWLASHDVVQHIATKLHLRPLERASALDLVSNWARRHVIHEAALLCQSRFGWEDATARCSPGDAQSLATRTQASGRATHGAKDFNARQIPSATNADMPTDGCAVNQRLELVKLPCPIAHAKIGRAVVDWITPLASSRVSIPRPVRWHMDKTRWVVDMDDDMWNDFCQRVDEPAELAAILAWYWSLADQGQTVVGNTANAADRLCAQKATSHHVMQAVGSRHTALPLPSANDVIAAMERWPLYRPHPALEIMDMAVACDADPKTALPKANSRSGRSRPSQTKTAQEAVDTSSKTILDESASERVPTTGSTPAATAASALKRDPKSKKTAAPKRKRATSKATTDATRSKSSLTDTEEAPKAKRRRHSRASSKTDTEDNEPDTSASPRRRKSIQGSPSSAKQKQTAKLSAKPTEKGSGSNNNNISNAASRKTTKKRPRPEAHSDTEPIQTTAASSIKKRRPSTLDDDAVSGDEDVDDIHNHDGDNKEEHDGEAEQASDHEEEMEIEVERGRSRKRDRGKRQAAKDNADTGDRRGRAQTREDRSKAKTKGESLPPSRVRSRSHSRGASKTRKSMSQDEKDQITHDSYKRYMKGKTPLPFRTPLPNKESEERLRQEKAQKLSLTSESQLGSMANWTKTDNNGKVHITRLLDPKDIASRNALRHYLPYLGFKCIGNVAEIKGLYRAIYEKHRRGELVLPYRSEAAARASGDVYSKSDLDEDSQGEEINVEVDDLHTDVTAGVDSGKADCSSGGKPIVPAKNRRATTSRASSQAKTDNSMNRRRTLQHRDRYEDEAEDDGDEDALDNSSQDDDDDGDEETAFNNRGSRGAQPTVSAKLQRQGGTVASKPSSVSDRLEQLDAGSDEDASDPDDDEDDYNRNNNNNNTHPPVAYKQPRSSHLSALGKRRDDHDDDSDENDGQPSENFDDDDDNSDSEAGGSVRAKKSQGQAQASHAKRRKHGGMGAKAPKQSIR